MRKLAGTLLMLVIVLSASPASSQYAGAYYSDMEEASASWLVDRIPNGAVFHFIDGGRYVNPIGAINTIAIVGKVRCRLHDRRGTFVFSCTLISRVKFINPRNFELDHLARSARIVVEDGDRIHRAVWAARDDVPRHSGSANVNARSVTLDAWVSNRARVKGRVLGARFSTRANNAWATIRKGAGAGVVYGLLGAAPYDLDEGRVVKRDVFTRRFATRRAAWDGLRAFVRSL